MRVAIIGSRNAGEVTKEFILRYIPKNVSEIISGGAVGIDTMAKIIASDLHVPFTEFLPKYKKYGRSAPLLRNKQIVAYSDLVLAFWDMHSAGTGNTIVQCIDHYVPIQVIPIHSCENR